MKDILARALVYMLGAVERDRLREERLQLMGWLADAKTENATLAETAARLRAALEDELRDADGGGQRTSNVALNLPISPAEAAAAERLKGGAR